MICFCEFIWREEAGTVKHPEMVVGRERESAQSVLLCDIRTQQNPERQFNSDSVKSGTCGLSESNWYSGFELFA